MLTVMKIAKIPAIPVVTTIRNDGCSDGAR